MNVTEELVIHTRQRSTAIVEMPQGILIVQEDDGVLGLPGGGIEAGETPEVALIRELWEETRLMVVSHTFLFDYFSPLKERETGLFRTHHFVFRVTATGTPEPQDGVVQIHFYQPKQPWRLVESARQILNRYRQL